MNRRSLLKGIAATALWPSAPRADTSRFAGGLYVQMGTSITAGLRAPGAYRTPGIVGERLQMRAEAVNVGLEGTCAAIGRGPDWDQISLYTLSDAIASVDWPQREAAFTRISKREKALGIGETKLPILRKLQAIDFSKVTHLGLEYGTNDFTLNMPLGRNTDATGATFKGALTYAARRLVAAYPKMKPFFITPSWFLDDKDRDTDSNPNKLGFFVKDYVDAMLEIADLNRIHCLDMWRRLGVNKDNYSEFTFDSRHPNAKGAELRGELTAAFINETY